MLPARQQAGTALSVRTEHPLRTVVVRAARVSRAHEPSPVAPEEVLPGAITEGMIDGQP